MGSLVSIQYLRGLAALAVVAFHTEHTSNLGQAGVDVFFVISGFIMWMVTAKPIGPLEFLRHRAIRIVPLYWIATLVMAAHQQASLADTVRSLLFWPYRDPDGNIWPVLVQGWTLNLEVFFYLLFAAALLLPRRMQLAFLTAVLLGLSAIGLAFQPEDAVLSTYTNQMLMEFLAGLWLSEAWLSGRLPRGEVGLFMVALSLTLFGLSLLCPTVEQWRFIVWGVPGLILVTGAVSIETAWGMPMQSLFKLMGDASYSIYLFHPFVLRTVLRGLQQFPPLIAVIDVLFAGAVIGLAAFHLLERPLTALLRRRTVRIASAPGAL